MNRGPKFTSSLFFALLLISSAIFSEYLHSAYALTPVADLTGKWSGFAQVSYTDTPCATSGKVNGFFTQNENNIHGEFSFVPTSAGSDSADYCSFEPWEIVVDGTVDGSKITLFDHSGITFSGWYASAGIKLDIKADWLAGTTQLSPTGFTPPAFQPKEEKKKDPVCKQDEVLVNGKCVPQQKEQPKEETKPIPKVSVETEDKPIIVDKDTTIILDYFPPEYKDEESLCDQYTCPDWVDKELSDKFKNFVLTGGKVLISPTDKNLFAFLKEGKAFFTDHYPKSLTGLEKETFIAIFAPDLVAVRENTEFTVEVTDEGTTVKVFEGVVYVITEHSDEPTVVNANEFAFANDKDVYTQPIKSNSADKWWEKVSQQKARPAVPTWIKNNANWWSEGQIDDNEFLNGVKYMVEKDIILLPKEDQSSEQSFTPIESKFLSTDSQEYVLPQTRGITTDVLLKGHVDDYYRGDKVYLVIEFPDKSTEQQEVLAANGDYSTRIALDRDSQIGEYKIKTVYKSAEVDSISFLVKNQQDEPQEQKNSSNVSKDVPKWIRNTAKWWSDGTISEDEFVNAIKFLVKERVIQID